MSDAKSRVYLAGAMTHTDDRGGAWRDRATALLSPGLEVVDPRHLELEGSHPAKIVATDTAAILSCQAVLAYGGAPSWGTAMELWYAKQVAVPVITWVEEERDGDKLSAWLLYATTVMRYGLEAGVAAVREMLHVPVR